jgi:flavodoxin
MKALIVFQSKTGHTEQAARDIARGLEQEGSECVLADAGSGRGVPDPSDFEVLVIGTPTYGNKRYRLPGGHVKTFLDSIPDGGLAGKPCGAFTVNAAMGGKTLVPNLEQALARKGGLVVAGGPVVRAGAPLSLWKGPDASEEDVKACEEFGRRIARSA